jgi:hypothetical protein
MTSAPSYLYAVYSCHIRYVCIYWVGPSVGRAAVGEIVFLYTHMYISIIHDMFLYDT